MYPFEVKFANDRIVKVEADKPSIAISKAEEIAKDIASCRNASEFYMKLFNGVWNPAHFENEVDSQNKL